MKRILFPVVWLLLCVLALEGALQLHYRWTTGQWLASRTALPLWEEDPDAGFRLRPLVHIVHNTKEFHTLIVTNADGFRVSEAGEEFHPGPAGPDTTRVMLLGPSFAFGWGVDHEATFLEALGRDLAEARPDLGVLELINAGVPALGPVQQLDWFRAGGRKWAPDLVIQLVYGSPEVSADYSGSLRVTDHGYLVPRDAGARQRAAAALKKSGIVFYTWSALTRPAPGRLVRGAGRKLAPHEAPFDPDDAAVRDADAFYDDFVATVRDAGAAPIVVFLPLAYRVHPEDAPRWRHRGVTDPEAGLAHDRAFAEHLAVRGIPFVDLTDPLRAAAADGERLYYRVDIHWTPKGHAVAARAVAEWILAEPGRFGLGEGGEG
ncbi:hypothetical protein K8I85_00080 [bacterium]|nr:hypothetical protein [bacterium]